MAEYHNWAIAVATGKVSNATPLNIFGYQVTADTTLRALWGVSNTDYVFPTNAQTLEVKSDDSADNMNLLIVGLDINYDEISEVVTLNGLTTVTTTSSFFRVNSTVILQGANTGTISVGINLDDITPTYYKIIRPGDGRCQESIYTVPRNKSFFLYRIDAFSSDSSSQNLRYSETIHLIT
jgi:hypothetical protein